jgi:hypothetical protein
MLDWLYLIYEYKKERIRSGITHNYRARRPYGTGKREKQETKRHRRKNYLKKKTVINIKLRPKKENT